MSKITLKCEYCSKEFERERGEYNRNLKRGSKNFCSLSCSISQRNIDFPTKGFPESLVGHSGNRLDKYSPFKKYLGSASRRNKEVNITWEDLKSKWEEQKGICPFTGWKLILPITSGKWPENSKSLERASLDRIDSSRGYLKGNIQFISPQANYAKSNYTKKEVLEFCRAVVEYNK